MTTATKEEEQLKKQEEADDDIIREKSAKSDRYYEAVGRRKLAVARIRLFTKGQGMTVNGKDYKEYFTTDTLQKIAESSLKKMKSFDRFKITAKTSGGGLKSQAEAIRHGTARVLVIFNADFKKRLRRAGYLTRDPRTKERKKYGLKKARKSPRWSKR